MTHDAHLFESTAPGEIEARGTWTTAEDAPQAAPEWLQRVCRR